MNNPAVVVGSDAIAEGAAPLLRELAATRRIGMLNTFAAKGLFAWNDPCHLGTIGLQARDLELAGLHDADVLLVGVPDDELSRQWLESAGARWRDTPAGDLAAQLHGNEEPTPRPPLYDALAGVCGPMYASDSVPINPARAAADLAAWLPAGAAVLARRDEAGFWLGRTFPTRELGSVRFGTRRGQVPALVHVVSDTADTADTADDDGAIVEVWSTRGAWLTPSERLERLRAAIEGGRGAVLTLGIDGAALDPLVAVAGPLLWPPPAI